LLSVVIDIFGATVGWRHVRGYRRTTGL